MVELCQSIDDVRGKGNNDEDFFSVTMEELNFPRHSPSNLKGIKHFAHACLFVIKVVIHIYFVNRNMYTEDESVFTHMVHKIFTNYFV